MSWVVERLGRLFVGLRVVPGRARSDMKRSAHVCKADVRVPLEVQCRAQGRWTRHTIQERTLFLPSLAHTKQIWHSLKNCKL